MLLTFEGQCICQNCSSEIRIIVVRKIEKNRHTIDLTDYY